MVVLTGPVTASSNRTCRIRLPLSLILCLSMSRNTDKANERDDNKYLQASLWMWVLKSLKCVYTRLLSSNNVNQSDLYSNAAYLHLDFYGSV